MACCVTQDSGLRRVRHDDDDMHAISDPICLPSQSPGTGHQRAWDPDANRTVTVATVTTRPDQKPYENDRPPAALPLHFRCTSDRLEYLVPGHCLFQHFSFSRPSSGIMPALANRQSRRTGQRDWPIQCADVPSLSLVLGLTATDLDNTSNQGKS